MKPSKYPEIKPLPNESVDSFLKGRLKMIQSKDGYRFSIDAVLLSEFVTIRQGDRVVDLGTGCGVILLLLLLTKPVGHALGIEIQEELATQASRNARLNGLAERMDIIMGDIKALPLAEQSADVILCNPPYRRMNSGRINPDPRRAIARHEILTSIDDILRASKTVLKKKGRLALIYPSTRLVDVFVRMKSFDLEPKRIRINYSTPESGAKLALIEATLGGKPGLDIEPPIMGQGSLEARGYSP